MTIRVSVVGYDLVGKRIADAVVCQRDMELTGVLEDEPRRRRLMAAQGVPLLENDADARKLIKDGKKMLSGGTISLQSESHPIEFRKVEIREIEP